MAKTTRPRARPSAPRTSPRPRARPNTVDLTPNAEDGDQMLAKRPKRPTDPTPNAERLLSPSADDLEFMRRRMRGDDDSRPVDEGDEFRERITAKMAKGGKAKAKKMSYGGKAKVKKMKDGGMCRGMGAATRGGNYKMG